MQSQHLSKQQFRPAKRKQHSRQPKAQTNQTRPATIRAPAPQYVDTVKAQKNRNLVTTPTLLNLPAAPPSTRAQSKKERDPSFTPHQTTNNCISHPGDNQRSKQPTNATP
ncbi:hypothetical protein Nepgr_006654 [Nepenthes gracilis]|uniref:Uncharacterized protein n=1 Tax=Nepenthes gracilis TaxID=150966 RepID=A0AAD3XHK0_NEPGR|nr:hypothetical protein Nepgr_006654 [Nepenthes gracilis]